MILMQTNFGTIKIKLDHKNTPLTAENFEQYVKDGFYNGTIFHRVIDGFMIQGGGFEPGMSQKKTRENIQNEANNSKKNMRGTLAMARTPDPHSASSQFFINVNDNGFLDFTDESPNGWGYCVFGEVAEGMDIVDQIKVVNTTNRMGHGDVPVDDVIIEKVTIGGE